MQPARVHGTLAPLKSCQWLELEETDEVGEASWAIGQSTCPKKAFRLLVHRIERGKEVYILPKRIEYLAVNDSLLKLV